MSKKTDYLLFMLCLLFFLACISKSKDSNGQIQVFEEKPVDSDQEGVVSLSIVFDPGSSFGEKRIQLELYENPINGAIPKTISPAGFYRESSDANTLFIRTPSQEYFGKMQIEGRNYLIPFYSKSFRKTILFGLKYLPESKSFVPSRIMGSCQDLEEYVLCPKLSVDKKRIDLLVRKNFHWNSIDGEMTLRQWLVIALVFGIAKYPVPLFGTVDFSENVEVVRTDTF
ncbi:putative lipoprotein [Leptospira wolffii serovar Khorat str. Khorat-H2]|nr:putative lipoprotein [Leptospira wolffii serovar Khorat str. Khorat-H2]